MARFFIDGLEIEINDPIFHQPTNEVTRVNHYTERDINDDPLAQLQNPTFL